MNHNIYEILDKFESARATLEETTREANDAVVEILKLLEMYGIIKDHHISEINSDFLKVEVSLYHSNRQVRAK